MATLRGGKGEARPEDYVVSGLVDFNDIYYDEHADLLYDLATQTVKHFRSYLSEEDAAKVLRYHQREIARFVHAQMLEHYWEDVAGYDVVVKKGFTELKRSAYSQLAKEPTADYRVSPSNKSNMAKYLFGGFKRCLYPVQKFALGGRTQARGDPGAGSEPLVQARQGPVPDLLSPRFGSPGIPAGLRGRGG